MCRSRYVDNGSLSGDDPAVAISEFTANARGPGGMFGASFSLCPSDALWRAGP